MASVLGLDVGDKRIGVALADLNAPFPQPLTTLTAGPHLRAELEKLIRQHKVDHIVIGLPRNQNGEETAQSARVRQIITLLKLPERVNLYWQDESLTSVKAEKELKKRKKNYQKGEVDALAATYILEDFLATIPNLATAGANSPEPSTAQKPIVAPKKKHLTKKRWLLAGLTIILLAAAIGVAGTLAWYKQQLSARTTNNVYHVVTIKSGQATQQIAAQLEQQQVIKSATAFTWYVRFERPQALQAGAYRLSSKQSVPELVAILGSGKVSSMNILIAPGLRLDQITAKLENAGYTSQEITAALTAARDHSLLKDLPADAKLEGYLFPDTYKIGPDTTAEQLIRLMLTTFEQKITPALRSGLQAQGQDFHQAVILASIVQKEVPDYATQQKVAQVFLKRLRIGMPLGADPTFKYAAAISNQPASPEIDSPYNTRRYPGLPPTAISNFNLSALQAVASPAATDYLYFVAGDDKQTYFSSSLAEHEALTRQHCTTLCQ